MLQFTNGFSCALDHENEELIVHFLQQAPRIGEDGAVADVRTEEVITLVMGKAVAENLAETLTEMLDNLSH